ncbi:MAG TPA: extensin family protein [Kofleriaceae bacterium]
MRWVVIALLLLAGTARADDKSCYAELETRGVGFKKAKKPGIAQAVEISGALGGVEVAGQGALVIDCSLAVSLAEAGRYLRALGVEKATYSSAYSRRNVRGTNRPSKHSYGLAIDVSHFSGAELGTMKIASDYEQGLGDAVDCLGTPATQAGAVLKVLQCQLVRSGLFHLVLSPDYDDAHHDHFHLEVRPWRERAELRASLPAIH